MPPARTPRTPPVESLPTASADDLQAVYDSFSRFLESVGPTPSPEAAAWLEQLRRRRFAATWASPGAGRGGNGPGGGGGGMPPPPWTDGGVVNTHLEDPDGGDVVNTTTTIPGEFPTIDLDVGHSGPDNGTEIIISTFGSGFGGSDLMGSVQLGGQDGVVPQIGSILTLGFGSGPFSPYWSVWKGTWSQSASAANVLTFDTTRGILAYLGWTFTGAHTVTCSPSSAETCTHVGLLLCGSINAAGQVSGYVVEINKATNFATISRIDNDAYIILDAGVPFGPYVSGQMLSFQQLGGTLKIFYNGANIDTLADATYLGGFVGIYALAAGGAGTTLTSITTS